MEFVTIDATQYAPYFVIVCIFVAMDFVTGFTQAAANHTLDSAIMREGLWHKCGILFAFCFGLAINVTMQFIDLGLVVPAVEAITIYIVVMEARSIWENISKLNSELSNLFDFGNDNPQGKHSRG